MDSEEMIWIRIEKTLKTLHFNNNPMDNGSFIMVRLKDDKVEETKNRKCANNIDSIQDSQETLLHTRMWRYLSALEKAKNADLNALATSGVKEGSQVIPRFCLVTSPISFA